MAISLAMIWVLQPFPATPRLAPVFNPLTHMVPPPFPIILVVPAVVIDLLLQRFGPGRDWRLSVLVGIGFLAVLVATQWIAAEFLLSPYARNALFGVDNWDYSSRLGPWRYEYWRTAKDPVTATGLAWAALFAVAGTRVGLWCGTWLSKIKR
jgi:hypothetical protein